MIEAISRIENIGTFHHFAPETPVRFQKLTLIYGPNGTGKTTLCAILRSLARNDADIPKGRKTLGRDGASRVDIRLAGGKSCIWNGNGWEGERPPIEIYDEQFVRENLYTETVEVDHKRNLLQVVLGEEAVRLQEEIKKLDDDSRETQGEITRHEAELTKIIGDRIKLNDFLNLQEDPEIDEKIASKSAEVEAHRDAEAIRTNPILQRLPLPAVPDHLQDILQRTMEQVAHDAEKKLEDHLHHCGLGSDGRRWLEQGLGFVREEADAPCPFCGQSLEPVKDLIQAYRAVFSEEYRALKGQIEKLEREVKSAFGEMPEARIAQIVAENRGRLAFWKKYVGPIGDEVGPPTDWESAWKTFRETALDALDQKSKAPLEPVAPDEVRRASERLKGTLGALDKYNEAIVELNHWIERRKTEASTEKLAEAQRQLDELHLIRKRYEPAVKDRCDQLDELRAKKEQITEDKENAQQMLRKQSERIAKVGQRVNELLDRFGAGFAIADMKQENPGGKPALGWAIEIRGHRVPLGKRDTPASIPHFKNTLSAGDRSALAFAFFIAQLEQKADLAERIVVLDDPFTSQDSSRRRTTLNEIRELVEKAANVVVCSHDIGFLLDLKRQRMRAAREEVEIKFGLEVGSSLKKNDLDTLFESRTTACEARLWNYLRRDEGDPRIVAADLRMFIEQRIKARFPEIRASNTPLGNVIGLLRQRGLRPEKDLEDLSTINQYASQFHHPEGGVDVLNVDPQELKAMIKLAIDVVRRMYTLQPTPG